jgi:TRAP-type mannitol/chloroaromatic compound transport system substrate-binding protein
MAWKSVDRYSKDYIELQKMGVKFYKTPDSILQAQCEMWDEILKKKSAENPMFKEIIASQFAFAERVSKWDSDYNVSQRIARNYFFGKKAAPAKAEPKTK